MDLKRFNQLVEAKEREQREKDKAEGALEQLKRRVKDEFDCAGLKDLRTQIANDEKEEAKLVWEFEEEMDELEGHDELHDDL